MKTPRDVSGAELAKALRKFGYQFSRQVGSHMMLTTQQNGEHHVVVPNHNPVKIGTLNGILSDVAEHLKSANLTWWSSFFVEKSIGSHAQHSLRRQR